MIGLIAAVSENNIIGKNNDLPWSKKYPQDLKRFKEITSNSIVIMGRKTFNSLNNKALPNRKNIVISSKFYSEDLNVSVAPSLSNALALAKFHDDTKDVWIIGGESIYKEALDKAIPSLIYLTVIPEVVPYIKTDFISTFPFINPKFYSVYCKTEKDNLLIVRYDKSA